MPKSLRRDLASYRQQIAQAAMALNPAIAFDLMAFTIAFKTLSHRSLQGGAAISFAAQYPTHAVRQDTTKAAEVLDSVKAALPLTWLEETTESARFAAFRALSRDYKNMILAYCTAATIQPQLHTPGALEDALKLTGARAADYWRPGDANYLSRVNKQQLLEIGRSICLSGESWAAR